MNAAQCDTMIWATRGRAWGFRFLLDAGLSDPLPEYERAIADLGEEAAAWRRGSGHVALRFPDPLGRRDSAGRVIPHEFVLFGDAAAGIESVEDGQTKVWPLVSETYARIWQAPNAPTS